MSPFLPQISALGANPHHHRHRCWHHQLCFCVVATRPVTRLKLLRWQPHFQRPSSRGLPQPSPPWPLQTTASRCGMRRGSRCEGLVWLALPRWVVQSQSQTELSVPHETSLIRRMPRMSARQSPALPRIASLYPADQSHHGVRRALLPIARVRSCCCLRHLPTTRQIWAYDPRHRDDRRQHMLYETAHSRAVMQAIATAWSVR
mmetsp:Transcript_148440/g.476742  ORF Transcript_148440/g.476742 Transcript_148440/m.476742 type:complete len:203 (-) Transcript_148440:900-1508(-)